jgi:hypothetical protein
MALDLSYVGSFQKGPRLFTESPLEAVWSQVARLGITAYIQEAVASSSPPPVRPWEEWGPYAVARIRQAVEFRRASRGTTLLTRPLPLYYAFLNLLRGALALDKQVCAGKAHGLTYTANPDLLRSAAHASSGTLSDYLTAISVSFSPVTSVSLLDCLSYIPEVSSEYIGLKSGWTNATAVRVEAAMSGKVLLHVHYQHDEAGFRKNWDAWLPQLASLCSLEPTGTTLRVAPSVDTSTLEAISDFLRSHLWVNLIWSDIPIWYVPLQQGSIPLLPRLAYYYVALFILSSAVRYEPESLIALTDPDSQLGWVLQHFLDAAERFFPQLVLHWLYAEPLFF